MKKHPVIAITGSSGAGASTIKAAFGDLLKCFTAKKFTTKENPIGVEIFVGMSVNLR